MNTNEYVSRSEVIKQLNVHFHTVHAMAKRGDIETIAIGTRKKYNLKKYIMENKSDKINNIIIDNKIDVCYCRVSSQKQKDDLSRQITYMHDQFPNHKIISDICSGLNFKRKGLEELIDLAMQNKLNSVTIMYKDRLARFGFDLLEMIFEKYSSANIIILSASETKLPMEELAEDVTAIMNVFVAKMNGMRKYKKKT